MPVPGACLAPRSFPNTWRLQDEENSCTEDDPVIAEYLQRVSFDVGKEGCNHGPGHKKRDQHAQCQHQRIVGAEEMSGLNQFVTSGGAHGGDGQEKGKFRRDFSVQSQKQTAYNG